MSYELTPAQLSLVQRTIANECNTNEFDLFMETCKTYGLDPFRRQIIPIIFNKDNPEKRKMEMIPTRDGFRVIASRCGDYRPASKPAEITYDQDLKGPTNPKGIVSATVYLWKRDAAGDWYEVAGEADWDEFAPIKPKVEWVDTGEVWPDSGKPKKTKRILPGEGELDASGNWAKMPKLMITKCAESQALRAGWPDQFGGLYSEEEMDKAVSDDLTASESVEMEKERRREEAVNLGKSILVTFGAELERVENGQFYDRVMEHTKDMAPEDAHAWTIQNRESLKDFWAAAPNDALELKKHLEEKQEGLGA